MRRHLAGAPLFVLAAATAFLVLFCAPGARAYSYAAAGAEPLIDARERALAGLRDGDFEEVGVASEGATDELTYLDERFGQTLVGDMKKAVAERDADAVEDVYRRAFALEVRRRLEAAEKELSDYQIAKGLVVRSKRFFDLLAPTLAPEARSAGVAALERCLEAIGNPGVFGVGQRPPEPAVFAKSAASVIESLTSP